MAVKTLDLEDVFLFLLDNVSFSTRYRGVMATVLSLPLMAPRTLLMVLILFINLVLVDRRLLGVLATKYVNGKSISEFILFRILFLFFCKPVPLRINLVDT